jgi:hypothetical protein
MLLLMNLGISFHGEPADGRKFRTGIVFLCLEACSWFLLSPVIPTLWWRLCTLAVAFVLCYIMSALILFLPFLDVGPNSSLGIPYWHIVASVGPAVAIAAWAHNVRIDVCCALLLMVTPAILIRNRRLGPSTALGLQYTRALSAR